MTAYVEIDDQGRATITHHLDSGWVLEPQGYIIRKGDLYFYVSANPDTRR